MPCPLILRTLHVAKAPGFSRRSFPPVPDLRMGLNIVWGANGVGKTTLSRCLRDLLWTSGTGGFEAEGHAELDGERWQLERRGAVLIQKRVADGRTSEGLWGAAEDAERYFFPLQELLRETGLGTGFQAYIRRRMADGLDLDAAAGTLNATPRPLDGRNPTLDACTRAEAAYVRLKQEQDAQGNLREQIAQSRAGLDGARQAVEALKVLGAALGLKTAETRAAAAQSALDAIPPAVARIMPDDPARLEERENRVITLGDGLKVEERQLEDLRRDRGALGVPPALWVDHPVQAALQRLREALPALRSALADAELGLRKAEAAEASWRTEFQWLLPAPPDPATLAGIAATLKHLAQACEPLRCRLEAADRRVRDLGAAPGAHPKDTVEHWASLQACLISWHRHQEGTRIPGAGPIPRFRRLLAVAAAALGVALALGLGRLGVGPWGFAAFLAPLAAWLCLRPAQPGAEVQEAARRTREDQAAAEALLAPFGELLPPEWTPAAVLELQAEVARRTGLVQLREIRTGTLQAALGERDAAQAAYAAWYDAWAAAAQQLGLRKDEPLLEGAPFFHCAEGLKAWLERLEQVRTAGEAARGARLALDGTCAELQDLLMNHAGLGPEACGGDPGDLAQAFLERRAKAAHLTERITDLTTRMTRQQDLELRSAQEDLDRFWTQRGFGAPDRDRLIALAGEVEAYRARAAEAQSRQGDLAALQAAAGPDVVRLAATRDLAGLRQEMQDQEDLAATLETRTAETTQLEARYGTLLAGDALARAREERGRLRGLRDRALQENAVARTVQLLITALKERHQREEQPQVLQRASGWLGRFTRNRYELGFDPIRGTYAWDLNLQKRFELEELSSGTRVQLLFAIRLAFIEEVEGQAVNMPVFLDEVLATSDDDRARAMIEVILELARDRQVFYFTAQRDEVEKLRLSAGVGGFHEVALDDLDRDGALSRNPLIPVALLDRRIPEPLPDFAAYGAACGTGGADLFGAIEGLHAWHIFTRSEELFGALNRSFRTVGQVLGDPILGGPELRRRADLLKRAQVLCHQGRGRRFREADLLDEDFTLANRKAKYWPDLLELAREADGDGQVFRAGLAKVKGLRGTLREDTESWMEAQGFAHPGEALGADAVLRQLHQEFGWLVVNSEERKVVERYVRAVTPRGSRAP